MTPRESAASLVVTGTCLIPCAVIRMIGGTAKMKTAAVTDAEPSEKTSTNGAR